MIYLIFDTQAQAQEALTQIWANMQPIKDITLTQTEVNPPITTSWAIERQRLDGKWVFEKPDNEHMNLVSGYFEEQYQETWFSN